MAWFCTKESGDKDVQVTHSEFPTIQARFGMTGEATTGSRLNKTESPSPSLLNTVYSEAGWFGVIFPVSSQTITPLGCDALQSSARYRLSLVLSSLNDDE